MGGVPSYWLIPAGAIIAALVAGLFSFFNLVLSKEQKLSELRQAWIDGLRNELAELISAVHAVKYIDSVYRFQHGDDLNHVDRSKALQEPHMRASTAVTRILLRLNPEDKNAATKELISQLDRMRGLFNASEYDGASACIVEIRKQAQIVLKAEWERVKRGEPTFRWSKRVALVVLTAAVLLGGYLAFQTRSLSDQSTMGSGVDPTTNTPTKDPSANNGMESTR